MLGSRAVLAVLVLLHAGLTSVAVAPSVDRAWAPSYFDGDDGDCLSLLLSEQSPALLAPVRDRTPVLLALAVVPIGRSMGRVCPAALPARVRAPPCP